MSSAALCRLFSLANSMSAFGVRSVPHLCHNPMVVPSNLQPGIAGSLRRGVQNCLQLFRSLIAQMTELKQCAVRPLWLDCFLSLGRAGHRGMGSELYSKVVLDGVAGRGQGPHSALLERKDAPSSTSLCSSVVCQGFTLGR